MELQFCLSDVGGHDPRKLRPSSHSDLCDLTLLKPLWQLFTQMEYSLFEDVTQAGILLPLHRALTELFFVTENRAQVRVCASAPLWEPRDVTGVLAELHREMGLQGDGCPGFPPPPPQGAGSTLRLFAQAWCQRGKQPLTAMSLGKQTNGLFLPPFFPTSAQ